jgi:valyl-tRNA synthetase
MFAPFLPFVTEEVWSWWQEGSIHRQPWPTAEEIREAAGAPTGDADVLLLAAAVLREVRKAKSEANVPLRTAARSVHVVAPADAKAYIEQVTDDLRDAGVAQDFRVEAGDGDLRVTVELEPAA